MPTNSHTLIELAPCGEPYPCRHMSCDCEPGEFVTPEELVCRLAEQLAQQPYHTNSTDDNNGD